MPSLVSVINAYGNCPPAIKALSVSLASRFEDFSVLSGLQGLRLWKFDRTTDAPDTQFTRNTKSQAQKSRGAIPALLQRLQISFQSGANHAQPEHLCQFATVRATNRDHRKRGA